MIFVQNKHYINQWNSEQVNESHILGKSEEKWLTNFIQYTRDTLNMIGVRTNAYEKLYINAKYCDNNYKYDMSSSIQ